MFKKLSAALLASCLVAPATAAVIVSGAAPSSFQVNFDGNVSTTNVAGLTATMMFNFLNTSNGGTTYNFIIR